MTAPPVLNTADGIRAFGDWALERAADQFREDGQLKASVAFIIATRRATGLPFDVATSVPVFARPGTPAQSDEFARLVEAKARELRAIGVLLLFNSTITPVPEGAPFEAVALSVEHLALPRPELRVRRIVEEDGARRLAPKVDVIVGDTEGRYTHLFDKTAFA